jgi:hypothetical protein
MASTYLVSTVKVLITINRQSGVYFISLTNSMYFTHIQVIQINKSSEYCADLLTLC